MGRLWLVAFAIMGGMVKKAKKIRLDELLVEQGTFPDAGTVLRAVLAHEVKVDDVYVTSAPSRWRRMPTSW